MSAAVHHRIIVLLDAELRLAGEALERYREACEVFKADPTSDDAHDAWNDSVLAVVAACYGALYHLSLPADRAECAVIVAKVPLPAVPALAGEKGASDG